MLLLWSIELNHEAWKTYIEYIYIIILPEEDKLLFESKNTEQIICEIRNNAKVRNIIKVWRNYTKRKGYLDSTYHNNV